MTSLQNIDRLKILTGTLELGFSKTLFANNQFCNWILEWTDRKRKPRSAAIELHSLI